MIIADRRERRCARTDDARAKSRTRRGLMILTGLLFGVRLAAQVQTEIPPVVPNAPRVAVDRVRPHGRALEGNLEGNAADRDVLVFLPPSYAKERSRRYPVVYALHGFSIGALQWAQEIHVPQTVEGAFAKGVKEMIVVLPDSKTVHNGSMYSSSVTTGDFERFVAQDLVAYMDARYRTIPERASRGLAGHSMGGYGVARIGMKHADVFGALYLMSACCLSARVGGASTPEDERMLKEIKNSEDEGRLPFLLRAQLATAAAWSPDPTNPPFYLDLPGEDPVMRQDILSRWAANAPLAFVDQYVGELRRFRGIAIDVGDQDGLRTDAEKFHAVLNRYGIDNSFEIYPGTHTSAVADRFQNHVLPFMGRTLCFRSQCPESPAGPSFPKTPGH